MQIVLFVQTVPSCAILLYPCKNLQSTVQYCAVLHSTAQFCIVLLCPWGGGHRMRNGLRPTVSAKIDLGHVEEGWALPKC